jgi:hypothetical protein
VQAVAQHTISAVLLSPCPSSSSTIQALDPVAWEKEHAVDPPATKRKSKSKIKKFEDGEEEEDLAAHGA